MIQVCRSDELIEAGDGVRFEIPGKDGSLPAFAVRFDGEVRAYLNQCRHIPVELDWQPGRFFDADGLYLICATHGATYQADDGLCVAGPCSGQALIALHVREAAGAVFVSMTPFSLTQD